MTYDLIVLGAGPAGYLAAQRAAGAGMSTLLVEKRFIGGVCLNEGCIPTKAMLYSAKIYDNAMHGGRYGVMVENAVLDHKTVVKRKDKIVKTLTAGVRATLKKDNVMVVEGFGKIMGRNAVGYEVEAGGELFTGKRLLIATGSMPVIPQIAGIKEGIDEGYVLTNREILSLEEVPESLVVIGGGAIGLEMASYFNSAGSKVMVVEMLDHIGGNTDRDISTILMKNYIKKGVEFKLDSKVVEIGKDSVTYESEGERIPVKAQKVLVSIGRKPVTEGIGLENIGVEVDKGRIVVDERCKTNIPEVYAAGDVNGYSMLAHTAFREAEVCINNMLGVKDIMRYNAIPSVIYTNPEVAGAGETEDTARKKGIDYDAANISMRYSGRYLAENEKGDGICKILTDKANQRLIGIHMIGNYSSEIIYGAGLMIEMEMRVRDVKELVFPHPTVSEIIREGVFSL